MVLLRPQEGMALHETCLEYGGGEEWGLGKEFAHQKSPNRTEYIFYSEPVK